MKTEQASTLSLDEIRDNIDRIDRQLVELIAERCNFATEAASFKKTMDEVSDISRVEEVISKVKSTARECNANQDIVEKVYRTMINAFIKEEASKVIPLFEQLNKSYY